MHYDSVPNPLLVCCMQVNKFSALTGYSAAVLVFGAANTTYPISAAPVIGTQRYEKEIVVSNLPDRDIYNQPLPPERMNTKAVMMKYGTSGVAKAFATDSAATLFGYTEHLAAMQRLLAAENAPPAPAAAAAAGRR